MAVQEQLAIQGFPPRSDGQVTPLELVRLAVAQNADIDKLTKLLDLQLRWEANKARKAFVEAMNAFKANPPQILKNKQVSFGNTHYSHATLDHVCDAVSKALSEHQISHRWKVEQDKEWIKVSCVLTHEMGHSEETTLQGVSDNSGSKNAIQAIASTVTYLERYTLLAATGLAAAGMDNDAQSNGNGGKYQDVNEAIEYMNNCRNLQELKQVFEHHYTAARDVSDQAAMRQLIQAKERCKKELQ